MKSVPGWSDWPPEGSGRNKSTLAADAAMFREHSGCNRNPYPGNIVQGKV